MATSKSVCLNCYREHVGLLRSCPLCGSADVTAETAGEVTPPPVPAFRHAGCDCGECVTIHYGPAHGWVEMALVKCAGAAMSVAGDEMRAGL